MTESSFSKLGFICGFMKNKPKLSMICVKYNMSPQAGFNGYQILLQIKRPGSPAENVPVVIYCPDPNPDQLIELDKCRSAGALMVYKKSLMLAEVVDMVKRIKQ
ncbi:hypothetical protein PHJA_002264500 [Phtheirospermum japonicum]|uniref:Uncharacterized protein n=1 Tax=Phtheirospermum japonicum TaxID=374723 RepID=A0A830D1U5_9LAMI|nr:hypothetical protein PHJA_002264500 [Phtheirospermum japonicum]